MHKEAEKNEVVIPLYIHIPAGKAHHQLNAMMKQNKNLVYHYEYKVICV